MAHWKVKPGQKGTLAGEYEYESGKAYGEYIWKVHQDEKPFLDQAKMDRETMTSKDTGYKKFATIPDVVAIEILEKHKLDIHDPVQSSDSNVMKRFKNIIKQEYPYLLSY